MVPPTRRSHASHDRRAQAVFDKARAALHQLELDQVLQNQITDQIFDTSTSTLFRAVHTADFIERLIEVTPSLTELQKQELREIANDLLVFARKAPLDAYERGRARQQEVRTATSHPVDRFLIDLRAEWLVFVHELDAEWQTVVRWLRS